MDSNEFDNLKKNWGFSQLQRPAHKKATPKHNFNLLTALHIENKKIYENAHTRVLKALLEYNTNEFLSSFLDRCGVTIVIPADKKRPINVVSECQYEKSNGKWSKKKKTDADENKDLCRPDCLVWMKNSFAVIIENKINNAPETERQIDNYLEAVRMDPTIFDDTCKNKNTWVIYLGGESGSVDLPSPYSLNINDANYLIEGKKKGRRNGHKLCLASYEDSILPWLEEDVLPRCPYGLPGLTGGVMVYIDYLKALYKKDDRIIDDAVVKVLRDKIKAPFYPKYREVMDYINSDRVSIGDQDKVFFKALKYYYLNKYFSFKTDDLNNTWVIRNTNNEVHVWKRSWERFQPKQRPSCDLCFVLWPYQIDDYMEKGKVDRNFTCQLRYKGKDIKISNSIKELTGYIFRANSQNKLSIPDGANFFDSFVDDPIIKKLCIKIDCLLNQTITNP